MAKWIIQDWTGRRVYEDRSFDTFMDGWVFLEEMHPDDDDWPEEFVVVPEGSN